MSEHNDASVQAPIYALRYDDDYPNGDAQAIAVDATGHRIYSHVSSSIYWSKHDIAAGLERVHGYTGEVLWVSREEMPDPCAGCDDCAADSEPSPEADR